MYVSLQAHNRSGAHDLLAACCLDSAAAVRHLHKHLLKQQQNAAAESEAAVPEETETADLTVYYDHAFAWEESAEAFIRPSTSR